MAKAIVVGAGVIGLTSAIRLREAGWDVEVVSKDFTPDTTSDVSAAMWWPFHAEPADKVLRWCMTAFESFRELEGMESGVSVRNGVFGFGPETPEWASLIPGARPAESDELFDGCSGGVVARAPMIEMNVFMPWLMRQVHSLGVTVECREVASLQGLSGDVIVNCTGLGTSSLVDDPLLVPARGQVVVFEQCGIEEFRGSEAGEWPMHVFPRRYDVIVGGTYEPGNESLIVDEDAERQIIDRAVAVAPQLVTAKRIGVKVGLRPNRSEVRLERDGRIIHNYGHGGGGVTLSWGCAAEVVELAER